MKSLLPALLLTPFLSLAAGQLTLVKDGKALYRIVLPARPTMAAWFAADDLNYHIRLITGTELPVVHENESSPDKGIYIGDTAAAKKNGLDFNKFAGEERIIQFSDSKIILGGYDQKNYQRIPYGKTCYPLNYQMGNRASFHAATDFMRQYMGIRWYAPGKDGTVYTPRRTLQVECRNMRRIPAMTAFREFFRSNPLYLFRNERHKNRFDNQLMAMHWGQSGCNYAQVNHTIYSLWIRYWGTTNDPYWGRYKHLFVEKRPEYFAQRNGPLTWNVGPLLRMYPNDPDLPVQVCESHPGPIEHFASDAYLLYSRTKPKNYYSYNTAVHQEKFPFYLPLEGEDSLDYCRCDKCKTLFKEKWINGKRPTNYIKFDWINKVARAAAEKDKNIGIATLAYLDSLPYPKGLKLEPNVSVELCIRPHNWIVGPDRRNGEIQNSMKHYQDWIDNEKGKRVLTVWCYYYGPSQTANNQEKYKYFLPYMMPRKFGKFVEKLRRDGIKGIFIEMSQEQNMSFFHQQLDIYVALRLADDESLKADELCDEFFRLYYGNAADAMKRFYTLVEDRVSNIANYPDRVYSTTEDTVWGRLGTKEFVAQLKACMDEAQRKAKTPQERKRLSWFVKGVWNEILTGRKNYDAQLLFRQRPLSELTLKKTAEAKGDPASVDWNRIEVQGPWKLLNGFPGDPSRKMQITFDSTHLYLLLSEKAEKTELSGKGRYPWENDGYEFHFAEYAEWPYKQFCVDFTGKTQAIRYTSENMVENSVEVKTDMRPVNRFENGRWILMVSIPLKELPFRFVTGKQFRANFFRSIPHTGKKLPMAWCPTFKSGFHHLSRMGKITVK